MGRAKAVLFSVLVFYLFASPAMAEFKKTKIAVLDFQLHGDRWETADMGKIVAEWLITALVKEGRFDVIERRLLEKVLSEQKLSVSGVVDEASASSIGRVLGAKVIISGSVMKFQNVMEVNARIIDVQSSSVIAAESVKSTSAVKLEDLVVQMAEKIISDFPLEGYIVQRNGDVVIIDLGKRAGVKTGMQFIVFKEGNVIKHPKTGEVLDIEMINTGMVEIKNVKDKTAEGMIVSETPQGPIEYGHMVKSAISTENSTPQRKITSLEEPKGTPAPPANMEEEFLELKRLRESGQKQWKVKYKALVRRLKTLEGRRKAEEIDLLFAKLYWAIDEPRHSKKFLERALSSNPKSFDALILKGDIHYDESMKIAPDKRAKKGEGPDAIRAYTSASDAVSDASLKALAYLKIGNVYADIMGDRAKANNYWQRAVEVAPLSDASKIAKERLSGK